MASKWEDIGIQLDIETGTLESLKPAGIDADKALPKMLTKVENGYPPRTVRDLYSALSSAPVGEKVLAETLLKKYTDQGRHLPVPQRLIHAHPLYYCSGTNIDVCVYACRSETHIPMGKAYRGGVGRGVYAPPPSSSPASLLS